MAVSFEDLKAIAYVLRNFRAEADGLRLNWEFQIPIPTKGGFVVLSAPVHGRTRDRSRREKGNTTRNSLLLQEWMCGAMTLDEVAAYIGYRLEARVSDPLDRAREVLVDALVHSGLHRKSALFVVSSGRAEIRQVVAHHLLGDDLDCAIPGSYVAALTNYLDRGAIRYFPPSKVRLGRAALVPVLKAAGGTLEIAMASSAARVPTGHIGMFSRYGTHGAVVNVVTQALPSCKRVLVELLPCGCGGKLDTYTHAAEVAKRVACSRCRCDGC